LEGTSILEISMDEGMGADELRRTGWLVVVVRGILS